MENLPYKFYDEEREIRFNKFDLPQPWINYLSNGRMHAFVSQAGGGMSWWLSPIAFRISRYRFYNMPIDSPGFYIYIRMEDGTVWSPTFRPSETAVDMRESAHAPGYSTFTAKKGGLAATLKLFMAQDYDALIWDLKLKNESGEDISCDVFAYVELSQFLSKEENTLGYYLKWNTRAVYDKELDAITYAYTAWMHPRASESPLVYFASDDKVKSFCCNRDTFCGNYRDERNPIEVESGMLSCTNLHGGEPCGALHRQVSVKSGEEKTTYYYLGVTEGALSDYDNAVSKTSETLAKLRTTGAVDEQFKKCTEWWSEHLSVFKCNIPDKDGERQINTWTPLQCVHTARYSRSISSSASGVRGIGFRDSAQDMLAQAYRKPEWAYEMLEYLAFQQFEDGHPVHIMWREERTPAQDITRSDNHLWLVYLAYAIIAETGDMSILNREIPYLAPDKINHTGSATLWEHLLRGIEFTENHLGEHGLPLILYSDWNDHIGPFGRRGKGESVMVSEQLIYALRQLSELALMRGEDELAAKFKGRINQQEDALSKYAWDGDWYIRGLDDDSMPIGSHSAKHMNIWLNAQSWMIISGAGEKNKNIYAMDSAREKLDTGLGLLLNAPGFPSWPAKESSMVNGLPAGFSENGGIFVQANCWAIMAEALLGRGDIAWHYYKQVMPHSVIKKMGVERYRSEAYAYCSTMLGVANEKFGWGVVSQVTGTAAWMDVVATQYILGIRPTLKGLLIDPSIPSEWDGYTVERIYRGRKLHISVNNPDHICHGVKSITINGDPIDITNGAYVSEQAIVNLDDAQITVIMG